MKKKRNVISALAMVIVLLASAGCQNQSEGIVTRKTEAGTETETAGLETGTDEAARMESEEASAAAQQTEAQAGLPGEPQAEEENDPQTGTSQPDGAQQTGEQRDRLKKELGIILDEIDMYADDADELSHELLQKEVWGDHPLGYIISGEKDVVRGFRPEDVRHFMDQYYTGQYLLISVAGNFSIEPMLDHIEALFGNISPGVSIPSGPEPVYRPATVCLHKDIEQIHLDLAFEGISCVHPDKYVLSVVNSILGGNGNSRLFQEVREERGLAYTVYSYGSSFKNCGLFQVYAAMAPEQTHQVLDAVLKAIDRMKREPVSEHELWLTKRQIRTELYMAAESTHDRMETNAKAWLYNETPETIEETAAHVDAVTAEDVSGFMQKYINFDKMGVAFVGNFSSMDVDMVNRVFEKWNIPQRCSRQKGCF